MRIGLHFFRMGVSFMRHLSESQRERLLGILLSILASLLFSVAENILSDGNEEELELEESL